MCFSKFGILTMLMLLLSFVSFLCCSENFRYVSLKLPLDVLAVTSCDLPIHCLSAVFVEGIIRQLDSMAECLYKHSRVIAILNLNYYHTTDCEAFCFYLYYCFSRVVQYV